MKRVNLRTAVVIALAVLLCAQLVLHNHSLLPDTGATPPLVCAVCAFGADQPTLAIPAILGLILIGLVLTPPPAALPPAVVTGIRSSRAPPL